VGLTAAFLLATSCSKDRPADQGERAVAVRTAKVELTRSAESAEYSAILAPDAQVDMAFRVSGYVVELYQMQGADGRRRPLEPGAHVAAGAVLAKIRPSDYQAAVDKAGAEAEEAQAAVRASEAQLAQVQANLTQAQMDFARVSILWQQDSIIKPAYDASKAKFDAAQAAVDAAKAQIVAARRRQDASEAQMREAQIALDDIQLRAPFDAVVLERRVELGSLAAAGAPAFILAGMRTMKARFNVPDFALSGFRQGQSLTLSVDAVSGRVKGRVLALAASADPKARSFEIEVAVPNTGGELRSGMIATVRQEVESDQHPRIQIPVTALVHDRATNRYLVYMVETSSGRSRAKAVTVEPGPLSGNQVVVLGGLQPGGRIVVMGANLLQSGDRVQEVE
jgi:RND family efflux transporter MFP subunit